MSDFARKHLLDDRLTHAEMWFGIAFTSFHAVTLWTPTIYFVFGIGRSLAA